MSWFGLGFFFGFQRCSFSFFLYQNKWGDVLEVASTSRENLPPKVLRLGSFVPEVHLEKVTKKNTSPPPSVCFSFKGWSLFFLVTSPYIYRYTFIPFFFGGWLGWVLVCSFLKFAYIFLRYCIFLFNSCSS